jgi:DNA-binding CsgD family transcriptional regulator
MLKGVLARIVDDPAAIVERDKGVAFLSAARPIYQLANLYYFSVNIPRESSGSFVQCAFSGDFASQAITPNRVSDDVLADLEIIKLAKQDKSGASSFPQFRLGASEDGGDTLLSAISLTSRGGEIAILGFSRDLAAIDIDADEAPSLAELKILGDYFHSHMLRRNGIDTSDALVVSARELDCLRWVAAGKSAWESSVILGISERTVRFHLNSAREKLNCTTTTQAVAKVVAQQLITL